MGTTNVEIVNLALMYLGEPAIVSLSGSQKAQVLATYFDQARDEALAQSFWAFALKRQRLNRLSQVENLTEFSFVYSRPSDVIRIIRITSDFPYVIEENRLFTDDPEPILQYVKQVDNPTMFPTYFIEVIATNLARKIATSLVQSPQLATQMNEAYFVALSLAKRYDNEGQSSTQVIPAQWGEVY